MKCLCWAIIGVLLCVTGVICSQQKLHQEQFPSSSIVESNFLRVKREGEHVELSRVKRLPGPAPEHELQDNTRAELTRVKRVDVEQPNRVKRAAPPKATLDDGIMDFFSNRNDITQEEEDWPKVDSNRKRLDHVIEQLPPKRLRDMTSIRGIHQVAPPKTTIDDRIRKFIRKRVELTEQDRASARENQDQLDPRFGE